MEELLEMITWSQLGIHEKPVSTLWAMAIDRTNNPGALIVDLNRLAC